MQKRKHASVATPSKGQKAQRESATRKLEKRKSVHCDSIPTQNIVGVHRVSCIPWSPSSIISLSASRDGSVCACLREEGEIEFYDVQSNSLIKVSDRHRKMRPFDSCMLVACAAGLPGNKSIDLGMMHVDLSWKYQFISHVHGSSR